MPSHIHLIFNAQNSDPRKSDLRSNIVSQQNSSNASTILNYLKDGSDIKFVNNGTANYALAIYGGKTWGSAAGITWNASFSDSGLHLGFNKGLNSFFNWSLFEWGYECN